ncbi:hypothetical protein NC651_012070 [Populus alba x Populus x berolinensis]|nr:hypothetical protein NC651_012070 [Populus alba x Populus x berolinensis]
METLSSSAAIVSSSSSPLSFFSPKRKELNSPPRLLRFHTSSKKDNKDSALHFQLYMIPASSLSSTTHALQGCGDGNGIERGICERMDYRFRHGRTFSASWSRGRIQYGEGLDSPVVSLHEITT